MQSMIRLFNAPRLRPLTTRRYFSTATVKDSLTGESLLSRQKLLAHIYSQNMKGAVDLVSKLRSEGKSPDITMYNAMIHGYAKTGNAEAAFQVVGLMFDDKIAPNKTTHQLLALCYSQLGKKDPVLSSADPSLVLQYRVRNDLLGLEDSNTPANKSVPEEKAPTYAEKTTTPAGKEPTAQAPTSQTTVKSAATSADAATPELKWTTYPKQNASQGDVAQEKETPIQFSKSPLPPNPPPPTNTPPSATIPPASEPSKKAPEVASVKPALGEEGKSASGTKEEYIPEKRWKAQSINDVVNKNTQSSTTAESSSSSPSSTATTPVKPEETQTKGKTWFSYPSSPLNAQVEEAFNSAPYQFTIDPLAPGKKATTSESSAAAQTPVKSDENVSKSFEFSPESRSFVLVSNGKVTGRSDETIQKSTSQPQQEKPTKNETTSVPPAAKQPPQNPTTPQPQSQSQQPAKTESPVANKQTPQTPPSQPTKAEQASMSTPPAKQPPQNTTSQPQTQQSVKADVKTEQATSTPSAKPSPQSSTTPQPESTPETKTPPASPQPIDLPSTSWTSRWFKFGFSAPETPAEKAPTTDSPVSSTNNEPTNNEPTKNEATKNEPTKPTPAAPATPVSPAPEPKSDWSLDAWLIENDLLDCKERLIGYGYRNKRDVMGLTNETLMRIGFKGANNLGTRRAILNAAKKIDA